MSQLYIKYFIKKYLFLTMIYKLITSMQISLKTWKRREGYDFENDFSHDKIDNKNNNSKWLLNENFIYTYKYM